MREGFRRPSRPFSHKNTLSGVLAQGVYPTAAPAPMVILSADLAPAPAAYARPPLARTLLSSVDLVGDQVKPPLDPSTVSQITEVTNTVRGWALPKP